MRRSYLALQNLRTVAIGGVCLVAAWVLLKGEVKRLQLPLAAESGLRQPAGDPRLISVRPLPELGGQMCQWVPASASAPTRMAFQESLSAADAKLSGNADRSPVRVLRDTYPTYSAAAVDAIRNEIVLQDENLFNIMVFDRLANTPSSADFTEPKRMIGGPKTTLEFECGVYVDTKTGDIYTLANDVGDRMAVFSRQAKGDVPPDRVLNTPHGTYGIAVDEERQEVYLSIQSGSVVVYKKDAKGDDKPVRTLEGERTRLGGVHGIAIDTKRKLMFVANHGNFRIRDGSKGGRIEPPSITIHPLEASGDTPPLRVLQGPQTQLNWPALIYADGEHGELYVANDGDDSILVFRETDGGDAAPIRVVKGPRTGLKYPSSVYVDTKNDELVVSNMGNHSATVYPRTAAGDTAPIRTIRSAPLGKLALTIVNPGGVAYDEKRDELLVPN